MAEYCNEFIMEEDPVENFAMQQVVPSRGVPAGGSAGQILRKKSAADYDTEWDSLDAGDISYDDSLTYAAGTVGQELGDLRNTLNHKADAIYDTAFGDIASFPDGADGLPVKDLTVGIEPVQSGSGDPSPTNVRPISGWTGANVSRTGVNVWDEEWRNGRYEDATGEYNNSYSNVASKNYIPVVPNTTYFFKKSIVANAYYYDANKNYIGVVTIQDAVTFTTPSNAHYMMFHVAGAYGTTYNHNISINYPSTDHDYHAYSGTTLPISWQSSAGTVYGGTLDVTSGVLTVDKFLASPSDFTAYGSAVSGDNKILQATISPAIINREIFPAISNIFKYQAQYSNPPAYTFYNSGNSQLRICIPSSLAPSDSAFVQWLNDNSAKFLCGLATPQTYQLDPVTVNTLLGQNNIWADCGPSTVEYPADTKLYIQKINAPTDDDMIADANIASGQYFIVNNNLYLSTTAILAGDPIKPGTNCTLTNLAAALNALNS